MELEEIERRYCAETALKHLQTQGIRYVPGRGNADSATFFVLGEAPGATENTQGKPFVGASGRVLTQLMESAGLSAEGNSCTGGCGEQHAQYDCPVIEETLPNTWITNTIKFRPPGNRNPTDGEIRASLPYLRLEWAAVGRPNVLVAVGACAWRALAQGRYDTLTKVAGKPQRLDNGQWIWPMVHPAYALRNFSYRPTMEKHWEALASWKRRMGL